MSFFAGRKPSFSFTKIGPVIRGFRSRPGAPQADPERNLPLSESSRTPQSAWDRKFFNSVTGETPSSLTQRRSESAAPGAAGPVGGGDGIAGKTLDAAFGPGYWNRLVGRGPVAPAADSLYTPAPFMPGQQGAFLGAPKPLTGPMGDKASDRAGLAANAAMYAPGGMSGLWGSKFKRAEKWQQTPLDQAAAISLRYQPRRARA